METAGQRDPSMAQLAPESEGIVRPTECSFAGSATSPSRGLGPGRGVEMAGIDTKDARRGGQGSAVGKPLAAKYRRQAVWSKSNPGHLSNSTLDAKAKCRSDLRIPPPSRHPRDRRCQPPAARPKSIDQRGPTKAEKGRLAQLVRALARQARGHKFESCIAHLCRRGLGCHPCKCPGLSGLLSGCSRHSEPRIAMTARQWLGIDEGAGRSAVFVLRA